MDPGASPVLLYDGTCGLCANSVQLVLRHDRRGILQFAPLDGVTGADVRRRHPELEGVDSMVWVEPGSPGAPARILTRSDAALRIARYLGGPWRLAAAARVLPRPLRDAMYDFVARHRHRLIPGGTACLVPAPEVQARFLD